MTQPRAVTDSVVPTSSRWARTFRLRRVLADVVVLAVIGLMAFAIWPARLGGATSYIIIKGTSMEPKFHTGDLAVIRAQDTYRKGDIVAYRIPDGSAGAGNLVIHRIIGRSHGGYLMQGDNRTTPDSWYPKSTDILGRFRLLVPLPGIQFWALVPWVCCAAIGVAIGWMYWPRRTDEKTSEDESSDTDAPIPMGARRRRRMERERAAVEAHRGVGRGRVDGRRKIAHGLDRVMTED